MTPPLVRQRIISAIQGREAEIGKKFKTLFEVKDYFGDHWNTGTYESTLEYFADQGRVVSQPVQRKNRLELIKELQAKPQLTAKERRALKNLRIKQRREIKKMRLAEKRARKLEKKRSRR